MKSRFLLRFAGAGLAIGLGVGLWRYWTGICNEACAAERALAMILLSFLLPAAAYWTLLVWTSASPRPRARIVAALLTGVCSVVSIWLSVTG
ncbi:hypothetical protein [Methylomonas koyamae]|uniref:Uncharacterized protein n=1 Tax=Methylomonas koyamae TaxID=702114 RepID=A0A291IFM2_9GAMM|nr:hypothetical protein [Methylomonas koyamae]ATG89143.1 hypothetical protein MKLM6_0874 [Methylomonas koyamae]OAI24126.1 hypothetical protein A1356_16650 [Methylomonas koyamae]